MFDFLENLKGGLFDLFKTKPRKLLSPLADETLPNVAPPNKYVKDLPDFWREPIDQATNSAVTSSLLSALLKQENRDFSPNSINEASQAAGGFQLTPITLEELKRTGMGEIDPFDPYQSAKGASAYLEKLLKQFGDLKLALAAYNAGPGNVRKFGGIPPFPETQNYVNSILKFMDESE